MSARLQFPLHVRLRFDSIEEINFKKLFSQLFASENSSLKGWFNTEDSSTPNESRSTSRKKCALGSWWGLLVLSRAMFLFVYYTIFAVVFGMLLSLSLSLLP